MFNSYYNDGLTHQYNNNVQYNVSRNENLAGPQHEIGISVISTNCPENRRQTRHTRKTSSRPHGVVENPGGRQDVSVLGGSHLGSMDSITSARSSTLTYESTLSAGQGHDPLRYSLRQPKHRDNTSLTSTTSSKKSVRLALGGEQTAV